MPGGELGVVLDSFPAGERGNPENVLFEEVVTFFQFGADGLGVFVGVGAAIIGGVKEVVAFGVLQQSRDFVLAHAESVGDVFEEDETEDGVLVDRGVERGTEPVGGVPEFVVEIAGEIVGSRLA